jgi:hypothetical protein
MAESRNQVHGLAFRSDTAHAPASRARYPFPLVLALLLAAGGFVGWIIALAIRLPSRYRADHWNVAWVGFDVMLLISLIATAWVFTRRPHLVPTAFVVTAVLLVCDAWFDVTTASGTGDTVVSVVCAAAFELPLAGALAWAARAAGEVRSAFRTPGRRHPVPRTACAALAGMTSYPLALPSGAAPDQRSGRG